MALKKPFANYAGKAKEMQSGDLIDPTCYSASGLTLTTVEVNLGASPLLSGSFTITGTGFSASRPVLIQLAAGPYTNKGTLADEAEMDLVTATAYVLNTTTIQVYWNSNSFVIGNFKFNYAIL